MATPKYPSDPQRRTALIDGRPFRYTSEGEGPTLLAFHGLPGSARDYRWLAPALEGVRFVRVDQPGFGETPLRTAPSPSLQERVRFAEAVVDALRLERFVVLGHSMGGPMAMGLAAARPRQVAGLGLLASVGLSMHRLARKGERRALVTAAVSAPGVRQLLSPVLRRGFRRAGFSRATPASEMVQSMRVFHALSFHAVGEAARGVRCPSLVAYAEDDRMVEPAIGMALGQALPAGPRLAFAEGGHNLQKTQALALGEALSRFTRARLG